MKSKVHIVAPASGLALAVLLFPVISPAADEFTLATAQAAAQKGDPKAEYFLAIHYASGNGVAQDYVRAAGYYRQAAEHGYAYAQNDLGAFYAKGLGVKQDFAEANQWYRRAADQGDSLAEFSLGRAYSLGRGVPKNMKEAMKWYHRAASQNQPDALLALGDIYMFGDAEIPINYPEAAKYYTNAIALGRAECLNSLGLIYERDHKAGQAVDCYRTAALKGDGRAMMNLGRMYEQGSGVDKDPVEAYKWFTLSLQHGLLVARHFQQELNGIDPLVKTKLTSQQIAEAMRRADEFNETNAASQNRQ